MNNFLKNVLNKLINYFRCELLPKAETPEAAQVLAMIKQMRKIKPSKENQRLLVKITQLFKQLNYQIELVNEFKGYPPKIRRAD